MNVRRTALRFVAAVVVLYLLYLTLMFFTQRSLIYPGWGYAFEPPAAPDGVERWVEETEVGEVHAFFAPAPEESAPGVILLHGNMQAAEHMFTVMGVYRQRGFSVLVPEYRGYAGAAGEPTEDGIAADLEVFAARFADDPHVDRDRIVYHGISLGGGVAGALAGRRAPRALVLQSTFTSLADMARARYAPGLLARDRFDTSGLLSATQIPALLLHGTEDTVIPVAHAHENARVANSAKLLLLPGGHGIPIDAPSAKKYWRTIFDFLHANGL